MTDDLASTDDPAVTDDPAATDDPARTDDRDPSGPPSDPRRPRPLIERLGMAAIALFCTALFGALAAASMASGELFLGVMAAIGAVMTAWVGLLTLVRG